MNLETVKRKIQEAETFLHRLYDEEKSRFGPTEKFEHDLTAFLGSTYSVEDVLRRHEINLLPTNERANWQRWITDWKDNLSPADKELLEIMNKNRNREVHSEGARYDARVESKPFLGTHLDQSTGSFVHMTAPHGVSLGSFDVKRYYFKCGGRDEPALNLCAQYLDLLRRLVSEFEAACFHP
jgi:hypothetical protein